MPNPKHLSVKEMIKKPFAKKELALKVEKELKEKEMRPEQIAETKIETKAEVIASAKQLEKLTKVPPLVVAAGLMSEEEKKRQKQIEKVLATGLEEIYLSMSAAKQREFKLAGERTASQINQLLSQIKVKIKEIINLIKKWLAIIPGLNQFFLEQEAKIKTDEILKLRNLNR